MARVLALDLGNRVGVALSDPRGLLARPLLVFKRGSRQEDFTRIAHLVAEHQVEKVIVGLPLNMDGSEGPQAAWVRDYSAALAQALAVPVELWDERLTTVEAQEIFHAQGKRVDRSRLDALAAAVILQSYLDAQAGLSRQGENHAAEMES